MGKQINVRRCETLGQKRTRESEMENTLMLGDMRLQAKKEPESQEWENELMLGDVRL